MFDAPLKDLLKVPFQRERLLRLLQFLLWAPRVDRQSLRADAIASLTGAVIVLP
ncbi:MAG: hypothetical protein VW338_05190 [Rhodospirillaceae bacterium]